jgi:hypothetical protein
MKKILYTLFAVSIIFAACKKEDEETNPVNTNTSNSIVGVWTPTSVTQDSSMITIIDGQTVDELDFGDGPEIMTYSGSVTMSPEEADLTGTLEFTDNGQAIFSGEGDTSTYIYSNNVITIIDDDGESNELTCTFIGSNIALTMSESMDTSWNDPMLILLDPVNYTQGDISISISYGMTINASKNNVINNNVNQRVRNIDYSWFTKPSFNNILKNIK